MATSTRLTDQYNDKKSYVVKDLIWKDHISKMDVAQKSFDSRWGFLNGQYPHATAYDPRRSPRELLARAGSPSKQKPKEFLEAIRERMAVSPSPSPVPATTSNLIGWRTVDKKCALEKYGKYARGQESLHKKFKWPIEGFD